MNTQALALACNQLGQDIAQLVVQRNTVQIELAAAREEIAALKKRVEELTPKDAAQPPTAPGTD